MDAIDLGRKFDSTLGAAEVNRSEKIYPTLHIDSDGDELPDLPDSGRMVVRFKKVAANVSVNRSGDKRSSVTLDILKIISVTREKEKSPSEALDDLASEFSGE